MDAQLRFVQTSCARLMVDRFSSDSRCPIVATVGRKGGRRALSSLVQRRGDPGSREPVMSEPPSGLGRRVAQHSAPPSRGRVKQDHSGSTRRDFKTRVTVFRTAARRVEPGCGPCRAPDCAFRGCSVPASTNSRSADSGIRMKRPTRTKRMRRCTTQRSTKRARTLSIAAAPSFVSSGSIVAVLRAIFTWRASGGSPAGVSANLGKPFAIASHH
ncbi:MAG: hypothetical protein QOG69_1287 [Actinomycetota bacterium]|nr:hypothetical protein [Actinomycetota bacterium]